jgi:3-hydroxyacyl-[acyl-carrier-protein] dehydratase
VNRVAEAGPATRRHLPDTDPPAVSSLCAIEVVRQERRAQTLSMTVRVRVDGSHLYLRGHFPGLPILPGVFVVETLCQAMAHGAGTGTGRWPALRSVRSLRLQAPLLDGDVLMLEIAARRHPDGGWAVTAEGSRTDGTTSARIRADFDRGDAADA